MNNKNILFLLIAILNCISLINAENVRYIVAIRRKKSDKVYDHESEEIQEKIDELVNDRMNDIYEIIEDNKDSYILENGKMDKNLDELEELNQLRKRSEKQTKLIFHNRNRNRLRNKKESDIIKRSLEWSNSTIEYIPFESDLVYHICPISNYYAINVYLSDETVEKVCNLSNVLYCEKDETIEIEHEVQDEITNINENEEINENEDIYENEEIDENEDINENESENKNKCKIKNKVVIKRINKNKSKSKSKSKSKRGNVSSSSTYYDINAIKKETKWSSVSVQSVPFTPNHLSILSQSPFVDPNKPYDNNFYYPSTAGKDIDIYFIDGGLTTNHEDFDTKERTITCDAMIADGIIHYTNAKEKANCILIENNLKHGNMVASVAGGKIHGVAKKANLHVIANDYKYSSFVAAVDYIMTNSKPEKTVISISIGRASYSQSEDEKLADLVREGYITFISASNENKDCCQGKNSEDFMAYPGYRKGIIVASAQSDYLYGDGYYRGITSNYGECVGIFGPRNVVCADPANGYNAVRNSSGTSCATPVVAGVAALIMAERSGTKFNLELMRKTLIDMSIKDAIHYIGSNNTPNRFINNGKLSIYQQSQKTSIKCGRNAKCTKGCCAKDGYCYTYENAPLDVCFIENGCQSNAGSCTSAQLVIEACEAELEKYQVCFNEISENIDAEKRAVRCKNLKNAQCMDLHRKLVNGVSVCNVAKKYKTFDLIKDFNKEKYYSMLDLCENNNYLSYKKECKAEIENYKECLYNEETINFNNKSSFNTNIGRCLDLKSEKCSALYNTKNAVKKLLPSCYFMNRYHGEDLLKQYLNTNILSNVSQSKEVYANYLQFCDKNPDVYQTVWIYNKNIDKCINSDIENGYRPTIGVCQNKSFSQWKISVAAEGYVKSVHNGLCLNLCNVNTGTVVMGECNKNAVIKNISNSYNKASITSDVYQNKCLGSYNLNNLKEIRLHFNTCNQESYDQQWEIRTTNPGEMRCGKDYNNRLCPYSQCCSKYGSCGLADTYCGAGCQSGLCNK
ncbi:subtilisin-like protein [Anaeromyces robustus]|uniref:Subtilisin-like protein n=1 Tax=Anaeromyces robustus TaxID=1754192 RepID=A0A1Y1VVX1_9FUNG|nr:subtilisin-like protein [Anaeromyces robustus]|eukprot:ORX65136.1 subtilisin-like protein [Anaeromyces robustus]